MSKKQVKNMEKSYTLPEQYMFHTPTDDTQEYEKYFLKVFDGGIVNKNTNYRFSGSPDANIFEYIIDGEGYIKSDQKVYRVKTGDCVIIKRTNHTKQKLEYYSSKDNPYVKIWFNAKGTFFDGLFNTFGAKDTISIKSINLFQNFEKILSTLSQNEYDYEFLSTEIFKIMNSVFRDVASKNEFDPSKTADIIKFYIDTTITNLPELPVLSKKFGMTENAFQNYFKNNFGVTYHRYILDRKLIISKKMLRDNNLTISQIAYSLGFCNQSHYSNQFKNKFGLYPLQYKAEIKNKPNGFLIIEKEASGND